VICASFSANNTCGWIYESHANWHAHQLPEYRDDVHCSEMLPNAPHLYLGSTRDRYCNWQFMEFLKDKYCYSAVNAIWTGKATADPFTAIMNAEGWTVAQLNDFFGEWAMHNVTWDYQDPAPSSTAGANQGALFRSKYGIVTDTSKSERRLRLTQLEPLELENRRFVVPTLQAPQRWGYDIVRLVPDSGATSVTVTFRGVLQAAANTDFRWGIVATDAGITKPRYSALQKGTDGELELCVGAGESLFLVVMATPSAMQQIVWDQLYPSVYRYPYLVGLKNAWPEGYQGGMQAACPSGTERVTNGGGCGPANLPTSVYVGPFAQVLGGTVSGNARIDDHAVILSGTVSGGTVSGTNSGLKSLETSFHQDLNGDGQVGTATSSTSTTQLAATSSSTSSNVQTSTSGNDAFVGTTKADTFSFAANFGNDVIKDFTASGPAHDTIQFSKSVFDSFASVLSHATQSGQDVVIATGSDTLTLKNMKVGSLTSQDFHFA